MVVMMNFSANVDHALNLEKLSPEYIEATHSDRGMEEMVETESEKEKEKKSHKRKSKKSIMDLSARKKDKNS